MRDSCKCKKDFWYDDELIFKKDEWCKQSPNIDIAFDYTHVVQDNTKKIRKIGYTTKDYEEYFYTIPELREQEIDKVLDDGS